MTAYQDDKKLKKEILKNHPLLTLWNDSQLSSLSNYLRSCFIPANTVIFHEGEEGDYCYFIISGQVSIEKNENEIHRPLATLQSPDVFGEAALFLSSPRSATAKALTDCELLALPLEAFRQMIHHSADANEAMTKIILERAKLYHVPHLTITTLTSGEGDVKYIFKNNETKSYVEMDEKEYHIWQLMNNGLSTKEVLMEVNHHYSMTARELWQFIIELEEIKLIEVSSLRHKPIKSEDMEHLYGWEKVVNKIQNYMEVDFNFLNIDDWLTKVYHKWVHYLVTPFATFFLCVTSFLGIIFFLLYTPAATQLMTHYSYTFLIIPFYLTMLCAIPHELGHAFAIKAFGKEVHSFGISWYWGNLIAYTDTSDAWLCSSKERVIIDLAGAYVQVVLAGIMSFIAYLSYDPTISLLFWLWALGNYLNIIIGMDTLLEFDGYYTMMDYFDHADLRKDAVIWLATEFKLCLRQPQLFKKYSHEVIYWLWGILFIIVEIYAIVFVQCTIFSDLVQNKYYWISWVILFLLVGISLLSVWTQARKIKKNKSL